MLTLFKMRCLTSMPLSSLTKSLASTRTNFKEPSTRPTYSFHDEYSADFGVVELRKRASLPSSWGCLASKRVSLCVSKSQSSNSSTKHKVVTGRKSLSPPSQSPHRQSRTNAHAVRIDDAVSASERSISPWEKTTSPRCMPGSKSSKSGRFRCFMPQTKDSVGYAAASLEEKSSLDRVEYRWNMCKGENHTSGLSGGVSFEACTAAKMPTAPNAATSTIATGLVLKARSRAPAGTVASGRQRTSQRYDSTRREFCDAGESVATASRATSDSISLAASAFSAVRKPQPESRFSGDAWRTCCW
mmetsp:Transcript_20900/g.70770  ORF Transcript_20900/g.70770 Transcript_20900/m.70770 type:complete len:301 (+) Transcript_20900:879-1781(+)